MLRFRCPCCAAVLSAPPSAAGRKTSCPACGQRLALPGRRPTIMAVEVLRDDERPPRCRTCGVRCRPVPTSRVAPCGCTVTVLSFLAFVIGGLFWLLFVPNILFFFALIVLPPLSMLSLLGLLIRQRCLTCPECGMDWD